MANGIANRMIATIISKTPRACDPAMYKSKPDTKTIASKVVATMVIVMSKPKTEQGNPATVLGSKLACYYQINLGGLGLGTERTGKTNIFPS